MNLKKCGVVIKCAFIMNTFYNKIMILKNNKVEKIYVYIKQIFVNKYIENIMSFL